MAHSQELSAAVFDYWSEPLNLNTSEQKLIHCQTALEEVTSWQREEGSARHLSVTVTERHYVDLLRQDYQDIARIMERRLQSDPEIILIFQPIPAHSGVRINRDQDEPSEMAALEGEKISPRKSNVYEDLKGVLGAGLEPAQPMGPGDFKSPVASPLSYC